MIEQPLLTETLSSRPLDQFIADMEAAMELAARDAVALYQLHGVAIVEVADGEIDWIEPPEKSSTVLFSA
jgi:hypothetical protein